MIRSLSLLSLLVPGAAFASSIAPSATIGGVDAGPVTKDVVSIFHNPAATAHLKGFDFVFDLQAASIHNYVEATRNEGIDPNTGELYELSVAEVVVPVFFLGGTYEVLQDKLVAGLGITPHFIGGGDYSGIEDDPPPYTGPQRYAGVSAKVISIAMMPSLAYRITEALSVGATFSYNIDIFDVVQASDPIGREGLGFGEDAAYTYDAYLSATGSGSHTTWGAGVLYEVAEGLEVGVSYIAPSTFSVEGDASIIAPPFLGDVTVPGTFTAQQPLPAISKLGISAQMTDKLRVGWILEHFAWGDCCSGEDGDLYIHVVSEDGDPIGAEDGMSIDVSEDIYSPRRLQNAINFATHAGYDLNEQTWFGVRGSYSHHAVPDFAVTATNLDYNSFGIAFGARRNLTESLILGLAFTHYQVQAREITNSARNAPQGSEDYIDDRFSPNGPFSASGNGNYHATNNVFGLRLAADF
jgi:long-subunit fatty acid transport protein